MSNYDPIQADQRHVSYSTLIAGRVNAILAESAHAACPPHEKRKARYKWQTSFQPIAAKISSR